VAEIRAKPSGIGVDVDVEMGVAGHGRVMSKRSPTLGGLEECRGWKQGGVLE